MSDAIYCDHCMAVFHNLFTREYRYSDKFPIHWDINEICKYVEENQDIIIWYWADLEQTEETFIKYCPICKKGRHFRSVCMM